MLKRFRQIARFFAEDPFKDSQGRFKTRWEVSEKPNIQILQEHEIPTFKVKFEDHHLDIIKLIEPKIDYAVIGTGKQQKVDFADALRQRFRIFGINIDLCPTVNLI